MRVPPPILVSDDTGDCVRGERRAGIKAQMSLGPRDRHIFERLRHRSPSVRWLSSSRTSSEASSTSSNPYMNDERTWPRSMSASAALRSPAITDSANPRVAATPAVRRMNQDFGGERRVGVRSRVVGVRRRSFPALLDGSVEPAPEGEQRDSQRRRDPGARAARRQRGDRRLLDAAATTFSRRSREATASRASTRAATASSSRPASWARRSASAASSALRFGIRAQSARRTCPMGVPTSPRPDRGARQCKPAGTPKCEGEPRSNVKTSWFGGR